MFEQTVEANWRTYLPFTQRICNAEVIQHLGVSPAQIIFGAAIDLDRGILQPNNYMDAHAHGQQSEYVNKLIAAQKATIKYAVDKQQERDSRELAERTAAISGEVTEFKAGTHVLIEYPNDGFLMRPRPPNKLLTNLRGPLQVVSNTGAEYTLRDASTTKDITVHVSRMREFHFDETRVNPLAVTVKNSDQFLVNAVINHTGYTGKGKQKKVSDLRLLVKWVGYEEPEWHPWKNFSANVIAHNYMKGFPELKKVIPKRYLQVEEDA